MDPTGAVIPNADVTVSNTQRGVSQTVKFDAEGRWLVSGMEPGPVKVSIAAPGFNGWIQDLEMAGSRGVRLGTTLQAGSVAETVTVTTNAMTLSDLSRVDQQVRKAQSAQMNAPSQNVLNLQRRVAGVLPVRVEVPRAGKSYRFVRPLVLEEETKVTFQYKSK